MMDLSLRPIWATLAGKISGSRTEIIANMEFGRIYLEFIFHVGCFERRVGP